MLSLIIPTIGRETLKKVLFGIQNSEDFEEINPEILVIFDGIKNENFSLLQKNFQNKNFIFLETQKKVFSGSTRNLGIKKSKGEILVFLGDDTVPEKSWLKKVYNFHKKNPQKNIGLLGNILLPKNLEQDYFHNWLQNHAQFSFNEIKKNGPTWKHFYTSNISVKKKIIEDALFSEKFFGWGFEDTEFGYRLAKKGLKLFFDETCVVRHEHHQTLEKILQNTRNSRKNAKNFESLHPEVKILPEHIKKYGIKKSILLRIAIFFTFFISPFSKKIFWWRQWKKAWLN